LTIVDLKPAEKQQPTRLISKNFILKTIANPKKPEGRGHGQRSEIRGQMIGYKPSKADR
jgi:hypothetical protein